MSDDTAGCEWTETGLEWCGADVTHTVDDECWIDQDPLRVCQAHAEQVPDVEWVEIERIEEADR